MSEEKLTFEIDGVQFEIQAKPWPHEEGKVWIPRLTGALMRALARGQSAGGLNDIAIIADLLANEERFVDFMTACERNTEVVRTNEDGTTTKLPFAKLARLLPGHLHVEILVLRAAVEVQWAPFFASSMSALDGLLPEEMKGALGS